MHRIRRPELNVSIIGLGKRVTRREISRKTYSETSYRQRLIERPFTDEYTHHVYHCAPRIRVEAATLGAAGFPRIALASIYSHSHSYLKITSMQRLPWMTIDDMQLVLDKYQSDIYHQVVQAHTVIHSFRNTHTRTHNIFVFCQFYFVK